MVSSSTLAAKIVDKGLDNMDFSMLPESLKFEILTVTGELFFKRNNVRDTVRSFVIARNMGRLAEIGGLLLAQNRFEDAAMFFIPTGNRKALEEAGFKCAEAGNYNLALKAFEASGNIRFAEFLRANFLQDNL